MSKAPGSVGTALPRLDAAETVAGEAQYLDDLSHPGMLHASLVLSTEPHARIVGIETREAEALPGVAAVMTAADFEPTLAGGFLRDESILARDKARFAGEPVAAVAAADQATARRAAALVKVLYEPIAAVLDIDRALSGDAPVIHEQLGQYEATRPGKGEGNIMWRASIAEGDAAAAFAECDVVVEGEYRTPAQQHVYLEPTGALAVPDRAGKVTIWSSCQSIALAQQRVAEWLDMPMSKVRCVTPRVGGGFGGKGSPHLQPIAAALALKTGRPVKLVLSRREDFLTMRSRHPARIRMKTGAKQDGTLVARICEIVLDCGAYADDSPGVVSVCALMARGPYRIPHVTAEALGVYTNKLRAGAFRGYGNPQISFASERQIDELAALLEMDPVGLRRKNALAAGERWFGGQTVEACALDRCLDAVESAAREAPPLPAPGPDMKRGLGFAAFAAPHGLLSTGANVQLRGDGSVALVTGVVDIGQGSDTVLSQICAETLLLPLDRVSFARPDSDVSPYDWKTAASRITYMSGRACRDAAIEVRDQIFAHAADMMECAEADLELRPGGLVGIKGVPGKEVSFAMVAGRSTYAAGGPIVGRKSVMFESPPIDRDLARESGLAFGAIGAYSFGAHAVELELDTVTGAVRVLRAWCAHDIGKAINPKLVEGQIEGGFVQGLGYALFEEMTWRDGRLQTADLQSYKVPGVLDVPPEIASIIIEEPEPTGPYGAKGVGEPPIVGAPAAIANAVSNALGRPMRVLPITGERVLAAIPH